jgi:hypothetical protein
MRTPISDPRGYTSQYGFPAYRVFVFGQEITADVIAITNEWGVGVQPGTCQITVVNQNYKYTITHNDMLQIAKYRSVSSELLSNLIDYSMPIALREPATEVLARTNDYVAFNPIGADNIAHDPSGKSLEAKQKVVGAKIRAGHMPYPANIPGEQVIEGQKVSNLPTPAYRYHYHVGKPIFHPMDPVRVFERDPYDPSIWYYAFTGYVSELSTHKGADGECTLTIACEQPSKLLRYARFTSNPGFTDISQVAVRDAILADVAFFSPFAVSMANLTLPEIIYAMMFGINAFQTNTLPNTLPLGSGANRFGAININSSVAGQPLDANGVEIAAEATENVYSANGYSTLRRRKWGVGHLNLKHSKIFIFGPAPATPTQGSMPSNPNDGLPIAMGEPVLISQDTKASLEKYQEAIDHIVKTTDLSTLRAKTDSATPIEEPGYQFSNILSREDLRGSSTIEEIEATITIIGSRPDIYPVDGGRVFMLLPRDVAGRNSSLASIEFIGSFALTTDWASRADVISEILDRIEFTWYVTPKGDYVVEMPLYDFAPSDFGVYGNKWYIKLEDTISMGTVFSDQNLYTLAVTHPSLIQNLPTPQSKDFARNMSVILWHLIGQYGVRQIPIQPRGYVYTTSGAQYYAHLCINRANANTFSQSADIVPNLCVWPNRPVMMDIIDHYGTVQNITQNITWGTPGDMTTNIGLSYMRGWDGTLKRSPDEPHVPIKQYFTIGGMMGRPLNYALLFDPNLRLEVPIPSGTGEVISTDASEPNTTI